MFVTVHSASSDPLWCLEDRERGSSFFLLRRLTLGHHGSRDRFRPKVSPLLVLHQRPHLPSARYPLTCVWAKSLQSCPTVQPRWAPLSVEFSRQEYWSDLPFLSPGDLLDSEIEPMSLTSPALAGRRVLYHWCHLGSPYPLHIRF